MKRGLNDTQSIVLESVHFEMWTHVGFRLGGGRAVVGQLILEPAGLISILEALRAAATRATTALAIEKALADFDCAWDKSSGFLVPCSLVALSQSHLGLSTAQTTYKRENSALLAGSPLANALGYPSRRGWHVGAGTLWLSMHSKSLAHWFQN